MPHILESPSNIRFGENWESYPDRSRCNISLGCDIERVRRKLDEDQDRLFSKEDDFELWLYEFPQWGYGVEQEGTVRKYQVNDTEVLERVWITDSSEYKHFGAFFVIDQPSRSELKVSSPTFRRILSYHNVFPSFFDVINEHGRRRKDIVQSSSQLFHFSASDTPAVEIAYNLQYFEIGNSGPISSQTGIYACYKSKWTWILLHPSEAILKSLEEFLIFDWNRYRELGEDLHLAPHVIIFSAVLKTWKAYLDHLEAELLKLETASRFPAPTEPFETTPDQTPDTNLLQNLRTLKSKLLKAADTISATAETITAFQSARDRRRPDFHTPHSALPAGISSLLTDTKSHKRRITSLISQLDTTTDFITTQATTRTLLLQLKQSQQSLLLAHSREPSAITAIHPLPSSMTGNGYRGASTQISKALTLVATLYLPLSLGTSLLFANGTTTTTRRGDGLEEVLVTEYAVPTRELWRFLVVVAVPLAVVILGVSVGVERVGEWVEGKGGFGVLGGKGLGEGEGGEVKREEVEGK